MNGIKTRENAHNLQDADVHLITVKGNRFEDGIRSSRHKRHSVIFTRFKNWYTCFSNATIFTITHPPKPWVSFLFPSI